MINLLPPEAKKQIRFGRRNGILVRYLIIAAAVVVTLTVEFVGAQLYLNQQIKTAQDEAASKNLALSKYKGLEKDVQAVNSRVTSVEKIQSTQAKFSLLLSDLAEATPKGVAITSISLTGDDKKPVRVTATAADYATALSFRDSIAKSPRISAADIESIQQTDKLKSVTVAFAFNPGKAR
ncbi:MAG TPA: PilN domain-containing protein [Candidatus Saccharimonadales bacterium]|nr:PilN domain-containing protein [Candidatus Saccharimonadales bacterium]